MNTLQPAWTRAVLVLLFLLIGSRVVFGADQPVQGELLSREGKVEFSGPKTNWVAAVEGQKLKVQDRLRTLELSRATLQLAELGRLRVNELTTVEILPPKEMARKATIDLKTGALYFFTRDKPREFLLQTPYGIGASRGTEFLTVVEPNGRAVLTVFDGEVELSNALGSIVLTNGEQGTIQAGQAPVKTPVLQVTNIVQWWLYYPGVLHSGDLSLNAAERGALSASLAAYEAGDLKGALETYPVGRTPQSEDERLYYAALLLSVGQADKSEPLLGSITTRPVLAAALQQIISIVNDRPVTTNAHPATATEWLAQSYVEQQATHLEAALRCARSATENAPSFGFAWERTAELEFSFGHIAAAKMALDKALELSPRNAQALALRGFILSAENHIKEAITIFDQAIAVDGALGNGWLGRGLCRIRSGDVKGGRNDIQTAASLESNRSLLRSYLGKAFSNVYDQPHAEKELRLARRLDPNDPTPWLYLALLEEQQNRINEGVDDLEKSLDLNHNRAVYRSRLLLDQDRAVRSASLASIYERAGLEQVAFREASRAVSYDYANYSAHLFLANSLDQLRDPTRFNLRYETAWLNELLLANLLAPASGGTLSRSISQQEYSKLFETDRAGLVSDTSWRSDKQFYEVASQFGTFGSTSYSIDAEYRHNDGVRPNNALTYSAETITIKQQLTSQDSFLVLASFYDFQSGDNFQYYDPQTSFRPDFRSDQQQTPTLLAAYHREWSPGVHTLVLGSRLQADQQVSDRNNHLYLYLPGNQNPLAFGTNELDTFPFNVDYHNQLEVYSAELNQIFQTENQILILGGRFQAGEVEAWDDLVPTNSASQPRFGRRHAVNEDVRRITGYGYYTARLPGNLLLTAGLAYDEINYPSNFETVPLSPGETIRTDVGPKAALVWAPRPEVTFRAAYARSIGGISIDQSFRLEPVQLAGFDQSFRNIMPVLPAGAVSAPSFEIFGGAMDLKFKSRTYFGIQGELRKSDADKTFGLFENTNPIPDPAISMRQSLKYEETILTATINQLIGHDWSVGAEYRFTHSFLETGFPNIPSPAVFPAYPNRNISADLHEVTPYVVFNHRSGFFARAEAQWYLQENRGYQPELPTTDFYQVNLYAGYRFPRRFGELTVGLLNVNGSDYHLNPLNAYNELPRERVWSIRLRLSF